MKALASSSSPTQRNQQNAGAHSGLAHPLGGTPDPLQSAPSGEVRGQAHKDALADAETLRLVAGELSWDDDLAYAVWTLMGEAEMEFAAYQPEWTYRRMAHAALEAVPGLR